MEQDRADGSEGVVAAALSPDDKDRLSRRLRALNCFDPWSSPYCTCGPKLSLDVYAGCGHECFYCYAAAYNWRYWGLDRVRPKADILERLRRDVRRIAEGADEDFRRLQGMWVALSNSSDPYPRLPGADEAELQLTRQALAILGQAAFPVLITTKSPLVARDLDLLSPTRSAITVTVTTLDPALAGAMEPHAPPPQDRLAGMRRCAAAGFGVACRLDPVIPGLNDDERGWRELAAALADSGVRQVISSTFKLQPKSGKRYREHFPQAYAQSSRLWGPSGDDGYRRLPADLRRNLMTRLKAIVESRGMTFSVCREGMPDLNTGACDGRGLAGL